MATPQGLWNVIILAVLFTVDAKPSCKFYGNKQQDLVCTPGDSDYILTRGLVSDNNGTTGITLKGCRITDVEYESFNDLFSLRYLDLSENKIQQLKLGVLDGARQVTYLNLSYNMLTDFPLGLFDQKPNVDVLDLKGNRINLIELGVFDPLQKLKHLDLSSNSILGRNLNPSIFDRNRLIEFMDFSRNNMLDSPENLLHSFQALDFLNLDRCSLTEVPSFATKSNLKTMKHLMLSTNRITKLDNPAIFADLDNLEIINLAENIIEYVDENVFKSLKKLKMIVMRNNKLRNLPDSLFQNIPKLINVDLAHNFIEYVPVNAFRGTPLKNLNLAVNRFTYLQDNFCLELKNSGARLTKFFFNQNPWQCACLKEFLKEVKIFGIQYNSDKYRGAEPVCVTTNEFYCKRHMSFNELYIEMYDDVIRSYRSR